MIGANSELCMNSPCEEAGAETPVEKQVEPRIDPRAGLYTPELGKPYSVPRRFGIGAILVITTCFAVLFAAFRMAGAPAIVPGLVAGFVLVVALAQMFLFGGRRPRVAAVVIGIGFVGVPLVASVGYDTLVSGNQPIFAKLTAFFLAPFVFSAFLLAGSLLGYIAGGVAAGIFLVIDHIDRLLGRRGSKADPGEAV